MELARLNAVDEDIFGWIIAPRINASGRIGDPYWAFYTLTTKPDYAEKLEKLNRQRQYLTNLIYEEAVSMLTEGDIVFLFSPNWNKGVVGIVAGRIARLTGKITFVGTLKNGMVTASGRNPTNANLVKVMESAKEYLENFGGHSGAGGISLKVENVEKCIEAMSNYVKENRIQSKPLEIDARIPFDSLTNEEVKLLKKWAPYGEGNPKPLFLDEVFVVGELEKYGYMKVYKVKSREGKFTILKSTVPLKEGTVNKIVFSAHKGVVVEDVLA